MVVLQPLRTDLEIICIQFARETFVWPGLRILWDLRLYKRIIFSYAYALSISKRTRPFTNLCEKFLRNSLRLWSNLFISAVLSSYLLSFLKTWNVFSHQLNSKRNDPVLLFKTIFRHLNCFLSSVAMDGKNRHRLKTVLILFLPKWLIKQLLCLVTLKQHGCAWLSTNTY